MQEDIFHKRCDNLVSEEEYSKRPTSYRNAIDNTCYTEQHTSSSDDFTMQNNDNDSSYAIAICLEQNSEQLHNTNLNECQFPNARMKNEMTRNDSYMTTGSNSSLLSNINENVSKNRFICVLVCVLMIIIILCISFIVALFILVFKLQNRLDNNSEKLQEASTICVPCNDLILGPFEEDNDKLNLLIEQNTNGIEHCCAKSSNQTSILMDLLYKRKDQQSQAQDTIDSESTSKCNSTCVVKDANRTAGHLLAGVQPPVSGDPPYNVQNWIHTGPPAHTQGIKVKESHIIIISSGFYFVYSQIFFSNLYHGQTVNTSQALYHYVYRWNFIYPNGGNELLLKSVRTQCWAENRVYGDYTSYTAGVFRLNVGDRLYVKASKLDLISRDPKASFFGVAKI